MDLTPLTGFIDWDNTVLAVIEVGAICISVALLYRIVVLIRIIIDNT